MLQKAYVLVGGGTGFVGRHLVKCLKDAGAKVHVITRKVNSPKEQISWAQIRDSGLPANTTAVVNLAGRNILEVRPWTEAYQREVYESRINTNRLLAEAIQSASKSVKSFVTVSGIGFYDANNHAKEFDESWSQPEKISPHSDYTMWLAREWERASELDEEKAPSTRRVVIRAGIVVGPDGGVIKGLKPSFQLYMGGVTGVGNQWFPWIHVDDLANMFKFAITNEHVNGVINGVAPEQVSNRDFSLALGKALNRPVLLRTPDFVLNMIFGPTRAQMLTTGPRVKTRAGLLGFRYQYPTIQDACKQSVASR